MGKWILCLVTYSSLSSAGADKKAEAGAGAATEFQFVSTCIQDFLPLEKVDRSYLHALSVVLLRYASWG